MHRAAAGRGDGEIVAVGIARIPEGLSAFRGLQFHRELDTEAAFPVFRRTEIGQARQWQLAGSAHRVRAAVDDEPLARDGPGVVLIPEHF